MLKFSNRISQISLLDIAVLGPVSHILSCLAVFAWSPMSRQAGNVRIDRDGPNARRRSVAV